jgi:hypothetical protein
MSYAINGSATSIGPTSVRWIPIVSIIDHNQQPVIAGFDIELVFDVSRPADGYQWLDNVSSTSVNLTIPDRWKTSFITLSSVYCEIMESPPQLDIHLEPFTLMVHGVYATI